MRKLKLLLHDHWCALNANTLSRNTCTRIRKTTSQMVCTHTSTLVRQHACRLTLTCDKRTCTRTFACTHAYAHAGGQWSKVWRLCRSRWTKRSGRLRRCAKSYKPRGARYTHIHTSAHANKHTAQSQVHAHTHKCTCKQAHCTEPGTCAHTHERTCTQAARRVEPGMRTFTHAHVHTNAHASGPPGVTIGDRCVWQQSLFGLWVDLRIAAWVAVRLRACAAAPLTDSRVDPWIAAWIFALCDLLSGSLHVAAVSV